MKSKTDISILDNLGLRRKADIEIGDNGSYESGLLVDANAVEKMIGERVDAVIDGASSTMDTLKEVETEISDLPTIRTSVQNIQALIDADSEDIDVAIDKFEEIVEFLDGIEPGSELYNIILSHVDSGNTGVVKHIEVLTQQQYADLATKDPNTEYNII